MFADAVGLRASLPPPAPCHPPAPSSTLTPSCDSSSSSLRAPSVTFTLKVVTLQNSLESAEHLAQLAYRAGVHYIVSGSFKSAALYLLAFDPVLKTLNVTSTTDAFGPHQYLALNGARDRLYATTWATPPILSSFAIGKSGSDSQAVPTIQHLNNVDIIATSSYISLTDRHIFSAGGPTAEVHEVGKDGEFGEKVQQLSFVSDEELETTDKTRKALRVGSHGFDLTKDGRAFIPHLGHNSIYMYETDKIGADGHLHLVDEVKSPRPKDAPRHVWPSADGKLLYSITEHTNFIDVYEIQSKTLKHIQSGAIVPPHLDSHRYRGNTLRISRDGRFIFGSTRGADPSIRGLVTAFELDPLTGRLSSETAVHYFETPTSGGIAGAIEPAFWKGSEGVGGQDYLLLVDEEQGFVRVLGWSGHFKRFAEVAKTQLPDGATASHALWLS